MRFVEVTFTVPGAAEVIRTLSGEGQVHVGAGTVLSEEQARTGIEAGARFIVSPSLELDLVPVCREAGVASIPAGATPTEIVRALRSGADLVKIFPADCVGGPHFIRQMLGPFPEARFMVSGGVNKENVAEYATLESRASCWAARFWRRSWPGRATTAWWRRRRSSWDWWTRRWPPPLPDRRRMTTREAQRMKGVPFSGIRKMMGRAGELEGEGKPVIHLEIGRPDFDTPDHIKAAAQRALDECKVHYTSNYGVPEIRRAIAGKLRSDNGLEFDENGEIAVTIGANEAVFMAVMAFITTATRCWCRIPRGSTISIASPWAGACP